MAQGREDVGFFECPGWTGESRWVGEEDYRYPFLHVQGKPSPAYEAMKHVRVDR